MSYRTPADDLQVLLLRLALGENLFRIGPQMGVSKNTLRERLVRAGLPTTRREMLRPNFIERAEARVS